MKGNKKALVISLATIGMSCALIGGATLALFTSQSPTDIAVTSGKIAVKAVVDEESLTLYSMGEEMDGTFAAGGTAEYTAETNSFEINGMVAGDYIEFDISIENSSTVSVQYQTSIAFDGNRKLFDAIDFKIGELELVQSGPSGTYYSNWTKLEKGEDGSSMHVSMGIPESYQDVIVNGDDTNSIQGKDCSITFNVMAVQGNAHTGAPVGSANDLKNALEEEGVTDVTLTDDVVVEKMYEDNASEGHRMDILVQPGQTYQSIDLNGNAFKGGLGLGFYTGYNYTEDAEVHLSNGTVGSLAPVSADNEGSVAYGLGLQGLNKNNPSNAKITIYLEDLEVYGGMCAITTNGMLTGLTVIANNCTFKSDWQVIGNVAAYLAGDVTYIFNDCTFESRAGINIRGGSVTLNNCTVTSLGTGANYSATNKDQTGGAFTDHSAIDILSTEGYSPISLYVYGGTLSSKARWGIHECHLTTSYTNTPECFVENLVIDENVKFEVADGYADLCLTHIGTNYEEEAHVWDNLPDTWEIYEGLTIDTTNDGSTRNRVK